MAYIRKHVWQNGEEGGTPLSAERLNEVEDGIETVDLVAGDALAIAASAEGVAIAAAADAAEATSTANTAESVANAAAATAQSASSTAATASQTANTAHTLAINVAAQAEDAQEAALEAVTVANAAVDIVSEARAAAGLVAWARRTESNPYANAKASGAAQPFLRLDCELMPGRTYEVTTSPLRIGMDPGAVPQVNLGYYVGGPADVYNRIFLTADRLAASAEGCSAGPLTAILMVEPTQSNVPIQFSFLLDIVIYSSSGQAGFRPDTLWPAEIIVRDVGPAIPPTSVYLNNSEDTVPYGEYVETQ